MEYLKQIVLWRIEMEFDLKNCKSIDKVNKLSKGIEELKESEKELRKTLGLIS